MDPVAVYPETFLLPHLGEKWIDHLAAPLWSHLRQINRRCDLTIVASQTVCQRLLHRGFDRLTTVPLGVDIPSFASATANPELRLHLLQACGFVDPATPLLISVSRLHPEKRLMMLMRAVTAINQQQPVALAIVGAGPWESLVGKAARQLSTPEMHLRALLDHYGQRHPFTPGLFKKHNLATMPPRY